MLEKTAADSGIHEVSVSDAILCSICVAGTVFVNSLRLSQSSTMLHVLLQMYNDCHCFLEGFKCVLVDALFNSAFGS